VVRTEEQIFVAYAVDSTPRQAIESVCEAIRSFTRPSYSPSVVTRPVLFPIPTGSEPGASLGYELSRELQKSVGAIVFVDDLRPNVAYELGILHGHGRFVLLVTSKRPDEVWRSISDLAGSALLDTSRSDLATGVHDYLASLYKRLAVSEPFAAPRLPLPGLNMIDSLTRRPEVPVTARDSTFGPAIIVDSWRGMTFELGWELLPDASFKVAARALSYASTYSIYFSLEFVDALGAKRGIWLGLTSNQGQVGIVSNERLMPSQGLSEDWRLLAGSFGELFRRGHVLGVRRIVRLQLVRIRAGNRTPDPHQKTAAWELGYFEVVGRAH
jgi:hypothetical protein